MPEFNDSTEYNAGSAGSTSTVDTGVELSSLLYQALRVAGVVKGAQRGPSPEQYADALLCFNRLVGWLNTNRLNAYSVRTDPFSMTAGKQTYTLGTGGEWDIPRPVKILRANLLISDGTKRKLDLYDADKWADISIPTLSTRPLVIRADYAAPLCNVAVFPVPDQDYGIELYSALKLTGGAELTDLIVYPDGYEEAIVLQLGLRIAVMFGLPVHPDLRADAANALSAVQSLNVPVVRLRTDPNLTGRPGRRGGGYEYWRTGGLY